MKSFGDMLNAGFRVGNAVGYVGGGVGRFARGEGGDVDFAGHGSVPGTDIKK